MSLTNSYVSCEFGTEQSMSKSCSKTSRSVIVPQFTKLKRNYSSKSEQTTCLPQLTCSPEPVIRTEEAKANANAAHILYLTSGFDSQAMTLPILDPARTLSMLSYHLGQGMNTLAQDQPDQFLINYS